MADKAARQLEAVKGIVGDIAGFLDLDMWVRLWDGSRLPLGGNVKGPLELSIASPGVIGALLRRPTLDTVIRLYISKGLDFSGGTLIDFGRMVDRGRARIRLDGKARFRLFGRLLPFLWAKDERPLEEHGFEGDRSGKSRSSADNQDYVGFHYNLSNDFYALFLDPEMVYSCAYFTDWSNDLATAQKSKLDMICKKLRLKPGDRFLDIGCGWGGLVCHAASNYGVEALGVTLSEEQLDYARAKVRRLGLETRVKLELKDYGALEGTFDKIASIGMYEHIGLANIPAYMKKVRSLLAENGLFLNHAIARRAKRPRRLLPERLRPEQRALQKYIFPGGELDDIGHTLSAMERAGFEVHDVEGWRQHYALTCQMWCERLTAEKDTAIRLVGEAKYRIFIAYLAGCSLSFRRGTARIFQTLVSRSARGAAPLPPTRADLYR